MGRGIALAAVLGALALLSSCDEDDTASPTSTATRPSSSSTSSPTSGTPAIPSPTPAIDEFGCERGPDGDKCRVIATYTPVPTPTLGPPPATYPPGTRSGVAEVDAIIDAVEQEDAARLAELVTFLTYPCEGEKPVQPHALRCREGQDPGDPLIGIWAVHVEGGLWPLEADGDRSRLVPLFEQMFRDRPWRLHSVFAPAGDEPELQYLRPEYIATFASWNPQSGPWYDSLQIRGGGLIAIEFALPLLVSEWDNPAHPGWILPRAR